MSLDLKTRPCGQKYQNANTDEKFEDVEDDEEKFEKDKINVNDEKLVCSIADALDKRYAAATVKSKIISRGIHRTAQNDPSFKNQDVRAKILKLIDGSDCSSGEINSNN